MNGDILSFVVLGICLSLGIHSVAQTSCEPKKLEAICFKLKDEKAPDKAQSTATTPVSCVGPHSVTLSWKASASLSSSHLNGEGYNLYRWKAGGSCMKIAQIVEHPVYEDCSVDAGQTYRYTVTAVKESCESEPSNVVEALIPQP